MDKVLQERLLTDKERPRSEMVGVSQERQIELEGGEKQEDTPAEMMSYDFPEDIGNYFAQIMSKGNAVPTNVTVKVTVILMIHMFVKFSLIYGLAQYFGIDVFGGSKWNESDAVKALTTPCYKAFKMKYAQCVGGEYVAAQENDYPPYANFIKSEEYLKFVNTTEGKQLCEVELEDNFEWIWDWTCSFEVDGTNGGTMGLLRWVLLFVVILTALADYTGLVQSIFRVRTISAEISPTIFQKLVFTVFCTARFVVMYLTTAILFEMTTNAQFYRSPMDLAMNFAALSFILGLNELLIVNTFFAKIKAKYQLFDGEETFSEDQVSYIDTPCQFISSTQLEKRKWLTWFKYIKFSVVIFIIQLVTVVQPWDMVKDQIDFKEAGGPYFLKKYGQWYDDNWYLKALNDREALGWYICVEEDEEPKKDCSSQLGSGKLEKKFDDYCEDDEDDLQICAYWRAQSD